MTPRFWRLTAGSVGCVALVAMLYVAATVPRSESPVAVASPASQAVAPVGPEIEIVSPTTAVAGLPVYLTGRRLGTVDEVGFTAGGTTHWLTTTISVAPSSRQFSILAPALAPGTYTVAALTAEGPSNAKHIKIIAAASLASGTACSLEWVGFEVLGADGALLACDQSGATARWAPAPAGPNAVPDVATGPPTTSSAGAPPVAATTSAKLP